MGCLTGDIYIYYFLFVEEAWGEAVCTLLLRLLIQFCLRYCIITEEETWDSKCMEVLCM